MHEKKKWARRETHSDVTAFPRDAGVTQRTNPLAHPLVDDLVATSSDEMSLRAEAAQAVLLELLLPLLMMDTWSQLADMHIVVNIPDLGWHDACIELREEPMEGPPGSIVLFHSQAAREEFYHARRHGRFAPGAAPAGLVIGFFLREMSELMSDPDSELPPVVAKVGPLSDYFSPTFGDLPTVTMEQEAVVLFHCVAFGLERMSEVFAQTDTPVSDAAGDFVNAFDGPEHEAAVAEIEAVQQALLQPVPFVHGGDRATLYLRDVDDAPGNEARDLGDSEAYGDYIHDNDDDLADLEDDDDLSDLYDPDDLAGVDEAEIDALVNPSLAQEVLDVVDEWCGTFPAHDDVQRLARLIGETLAAWSTVEGCDAWDWDDQFIEGYLLDFYPEAMWVPPFLHEPFYEVLCAVMSHAWGARDLPAMRGCSIILRLTDDDLEQEFRLAMSDRSRWSEQKTALHAEWERKQRNQRRRRRKVA